MRIVYVLTSLGMGGAERQVLALAGRMAQRGHTVALLILRPRLEHEWPTILPVVPLQMRKTPASVLTGMARARGFLRGFQPDLLHSHSFHANIVARLLKLSFPEAQILSTVHNVYEGGWPRMLAYRLTDGLSCRTTAVSEAAALRFVRLKAVPPRKCIVFPNGIDTTEFAPDAARRVRVRAEMNASEEFIWLAAGRIVPAKDYPNLLRAFAQVHASPSHSDARLWIAGDASGAHGSSLRALAAELGLHESVRWLGLRRDLPALFDAADGFVLASAWEGMPLAVGEAMAMEKPVVATDVGGVGELVGDAGVLVSPNRPDALAEALLQMMQTSRGERHKLGCVARARIQTGFSMDARVEEWEALYRTVLNNRS
jgi:glycosyltransferase involved in cell wall biosynthesis